jgi:hypothetical protein
MGAKEDESSTGCIWVAGFYHVMARSCLVGVLKLNTLGTGDADLRHLRFGVINVKDG